MVRGGRDGASLGGKDAWRRRARKGLAALAVALLSLLGLYLVAINVFLSTSLFEKVVNADPDTLRVTYERGWSLWPGRIHARGLTIRSSDSQVQFLLRIDRCDFDVSFKDLALARTFHVSRVEGSGVSFQGRRRIPGPDATPEYVESIPQIPGFDRIPLSLLEPPDLRERWDDRYYKLWTVELEGVVAEHVREVWIDAARFEGDARVTGGFRLRPIRQVEVRDVDVQVREGRASAYRRPVLEPVAGSMHVHVRPFDPRVVAGKPLLGHVSLTTALHGAVPDLGHVPWRLLAPVELAGPLELRSLALRIEDGRLVAGSHLDLALAKATLDVASHRVTGDFALQADVGSDAGGPRLAFRLEGREVAASRLSPGSQAPLFRAPALDVAGDARSLDLAGALLEDLHAVGNLPAAHMPDLRALDAYVAPGGAFGFEGGRAGARASLEVWHGDRRAKGTVTLDAEDVGLRVAKVRLSGGSVIQASFDAWRWEARRIDGARAQVHVAQGAVADEAKPDRPLVTVRELALSVDAPEVDVDEPLRAFTAKVDMPQARLVDRGLLQAYLPRGKDMRLAQDHADFDARCELEVRDRLGHGTLALHASRLGLTLEDLELFTELRAHARVHDWAWERGDAVVDAARVDLTKVDVKRRGASGRALVIPHLSLEARSRRFAFSDPLAQLDLQGSIRGGEVRDAAALNAFLPRGADVVFDARPEAGRFDAQVKGTVERHVARGRLSAQGEGLGVRGAKLGVLGGLEAAARVEDWRLDEQKLRVVSSLVRFVDVEARFGAAPAPAAAAAPAPPAAAPGSPLVPKGPDLTARKIELRATIPELDVAHPSLRGVDYRLILEDARIDDARRLGELVAAKDGYAFGVESGRARGAVDLTVTASEQKASGGATIVVENARIRFNKTHLAGDFDVVVQVKGYDLARDAVDVSDSRITMRNVRATGAGADTSGWSGNMALLEGWAHLSAAPSFDGHLQLHAVDASPLLTLVVQDRLPGFLVNAMKAPQLDGQARLLVEPGRSALTNVHVRGDDVVLRGDYVVSGESVRGAVKVAKGPLSAGIKVDDNGTYVRLFGLDSWLKEESVAALALLRKGQDEARAKAATKREPDPDAKAKAKE